jgi:hypothetical protein
MPDNEICPCLYVLSDTFNRCWADEARAIGDTFNTAAETTHTSLNTCRQDVHDERVTQTARPPLARPGAALHVARGERRRRDHRGLGDGDLL